MLNTDWVKLSHFYIIMNIIVKVVLEFVDAVFCRIMNLYSFLLLRNSLLYSVKLLACHQLT